MGLGKQLQEVLGLRRTPVSIGLLEVPPLGLTRWNDGEVPAGCSFWGHAMNGRSFYTEPADHYNCAVGCHTHGIPLPVERAHELAQTLDLMVEKDYLRMEEVPDIPALKGCPPYVAYAPVDLATFDPDVVLIECTPLQAMLLYEAALRAGAGNMISATLGRPSCAVLPQTVNSGSACISLACQGNRVFTGISKDEMYFAMPGDQWPAIAESAFSVREANSAMLEFYSGQSSLFPQTTATNSDLDT